MPNAQTAIFELDYKIVVRQAISGTMSAAMSFFDLLNHLLNFIAPACGVGFLLSVLAPIFQRKMPFTRTTLAQAAMNSVAGVVALTGGLLFFGRDGKMASYALLVLACGTLQWWHQRR
jgi:hypothetical protein